MENFDFNGRRKTLKLMALGASTILFYGCGSDDDSSQPSSASYFPNSIASGDPRESSVILWTRVYDSKNSSSKSVTLEIATDEAFTNVIQTKSLTALSDYDGCIKYRATNLSSGTHYYYRFKYNEIYSNTGRTKTAPSSMADVNVKYSFVSCQDYNGRYYNSWAKMLEEDDLDFIVHLGDYIYETTGDPTFQITSGRKVEFSDVAGAIKLGSEGAYYYAASSLSNYRELYKTYRSDEMLKKIHERFPMIAIWDDHEYSDDCYGATATYHDGKESEYNITRRHNAERAFFEYMPIEVGLDTNGILSVDSEILYDASTNKPVIYRDFKFGKNVHLVMTDYRSFRPDHLVPEDAFPGTVILSKEELQGFLPLIGMSYEALESVFGPYVNIDSDAYAQIKQILLAVTTQAYMAEGLSESDAGAKAVTKISGNLSSYAIYLLLAQYQAVDPTFTIPDVFNPTADEYNAADKGVAYLHLGKQSLFSSMGSRYMVVKDTFDLYAAYKFATTSGASENAYGAEQAAWLTQTISSSSASWLIYGSSVSFTPMILNLTSIETIPSALRNKFYLNVDQMDGFKNFKEQVLLPLLRTKKSVVISGDIHASFVSDHKQGSGANALFEFTGTSISSGTFSEMLTKQIAADATLSSIPGIDTLVAQLDLLLLGANQAENATNSSFTNNIFADSTHNGFMMMEVSGSKISTTLQRIGMDEVTNKMYSSSAYSGKFQSVSFEVSNNTLTQL